MKKWILLTAVSALPLMTMAQDDDMYFVPTKENVEKEAQTYGLPRDTYYSGSQRSVDEYNRRAWSKVTPIDSAGNDIIDFSAVRGVYPDSTYTENNDRDYRYMRRMSRFDDYTPSQAYWDGFRDGAWSSPWYYSRHYVWYDPWYWDDPWYYGYYGYYGYYSPWRITYYRPWGYYGWYRPHYRYVGTVYRPHVVRVNRHATGSRTFSNGNSARFSHGTFGGRSLSGSQFGGSSRSHSGSFGSFGGSLNSSGSSFGGGHGGGSRGGGGRFGR